MKWTRRGIIVSALGAAGSLAMPGLSTRCAAAEGILQIRGTAFGTTWRAVLATEFEPFRLVQDIDLLLQSLNATMSPYLARSELARLNTALRTDISGPLADVMREALRIARLTNGAFDPTVGPIVGKYGFGPIHGSMAAENRTESYQGFELVGQRVTKSSQALTFDPCGIGKGYAVDRIGVLLSERGVRSFLIEFGGEVLVRGRHPSGRRWRVAIEDPAPDAKEARHAVTLTDCALATSGDRHNSYEVAGRRYSHIIDPSTSAPASDRVASVSVIAGTAMTADALATALMAMGPVEGLALAEREALPALFVIREGETYRDIANAMFRERLMA